MKPEASRIVLTGFMGVGKSTVARHLAYLLGAKRVDLDQFIERSVKQKIPEIFSERGEKVFRDLETKYLKEILRSDVKIIALGGGAWTFPRNREVIEDSGAISVWLESTFDHCWRNIRFSKCERPLVKDKEAAKKLFDERAKLYCLADWHFVIKPGADSLDIAKQIASDIFEK